MRKFLLGLVLVIGAGAASELAVAAPLPPAATAVTAAQLQAAQDSPVQLAQYNRHRRCRPYYRHHRRYCR